MISRVYVLPQKKDTRGKVYLKSLTGLEISGKISDINIIDSYLISHELDSREVDMGAEALTNPILEKYTIDIFPKVKKFTYAIEIGYLPGVTDNVGHTAKETIADLLHLQKDTSLEVYTSKIFLISGTIKFDDAKKIAQSLHNSLIERAYIASFEEVNKAQGLPKKLPEVVIEETASVIEVSLYVHDDELIKIGKEGILDPETKERRGPLALDLVSMKAIQDHFTKLKRNPTDIELESLAQTWSEHCKHTIFANPIDDIKDGLYKTYIKGATNEIRKMKGKNDFCVSVFSDNAGGIAFDENYLITHKVETHNSPSALDPYGGAITGIVGVNRDTIGFGLGAKPVANTYGFCFGHPENDKPLYRDKDMKVKMFPPKRIMEGVIKGVNHGGNTSGIPTINGFVHYDDRYRGKPLVFVGTVGLIPRKINGKLSHEKSAQPGDYIVVVGGRVGKDGIHGATFSSVVMDSNSPATAVQIGDPITQKKLSDAIVKEAREMNLYNSITDNGAGGISCSVAEMAKECGGALVDLEKVPLKYAGLRPWEIWISESQERMTLAVPKKKWDVFRKLMESRGVEASVIGEFTDSGRCIVHYGDKRIMDLSMEFLHNGLPKQNLTTEKVENKYPEPVLEKKTSYTKDFENLVSNKNVSGYSFISEQYDHEVQATSVLKPLSGSGRINTEAQVFRPVLDSNKGVVVSAGVYPSYGDISTYHMASSAIDTAIRNAVAAGGSLKHLAILDNFCWSSSGDKKRLYELVETVKACSEYAIGYGTPFISGKDSMWNDFKGYDEKGNPTVISAPPTLLISAIGVMEDIFKTVSPEFKEAGDVIYLIGETNDELGGSEYLVMQDMVGNNVPKVNLEKNIKTYAAVEKVIGENLLQSSISVNSGGLSVALAKASVGGMLGAKIDVTKIPGEANTTTAKLFSESQGRILVSVSSRKKSPFEKFMKGVPFVKLGEVTKDGKVVVVEHHKKVVDSSIKKLSTLYHAFSNKMK